MQNLGPKFVHAEVGYQQKWLPCTPSHLSCSVLPQAPDTGMVSGVSNRDLNPAPLPTATGRVSFFSPFFLFFFLLFLVSVFYPFCFLFSLSSSCTSRLCQAGGEFPPSEKCSVLPNVFPPTGTACLRRGILRDVARQMC